MSDEENPIQSYGVEICDTQNSDDKQSTENHVIDIELGLLA